MDQIRILISAEVCVNVKGTGQFKFAFALFTFRYAGDDNISLEKMG